ncbi:uncharacterized protein AB675_7740 [Cyphellophora attinorum]|uniref:Uncharacterized protein n=1 Tax=Cyphellophora attinorum TaxID=1664694 RepID=A0A0N1HQM0_9EURO|nr:uncharacterized protein AB675_7740 [Phialophora attinorum]KPI40285.1 hypothetical protein AB675_7740 [Phialophora attinorum]
MGIPPELRRQILEYAINDLVYVDYRWSNNHDRLSWRPSCGSDTWLQHMMLVSKDFGAMARDVIARAAHLTLSDFTLREELLDLTSGDLSDELMWKTAERQRTRFLASIHNGASWDQRDSLDVPAAFSEYLLSANSLWIYQPKMAWGALHDSFDVSPFRFLRNVTLHAGNIEDWPDNKIKIMMHMASRDPEWAIAKVIHLMGSLADPSVIPSQQLAAVWADYIPHLDHYRDHVRAAYRQGSRPCHPYFLRSAFRRRLQGVTVSVEALLKWLCEVDMRVGRRNIAGLMDSTIPEVTFNTEGATLPTWPNKLFPRVSFSNKETKVFVNVWDAVEVATRIF